MSRTKKNRFQNSHRILALARLSLNLILNAIVLFQPYLISRLNDCLNESPLGLCNPG